MVEVTDEEFEALVDRALARIPVQMRDLIDNCLITIADDAPVGQALLGLYEGVALTRRDNYAGYTPDVITLFQRPLMEMCMDQAQLEEQVYVTVVHEIAHHFGISDDRLRELGRY